MERYNEYFVCDNLLKPYKGFRAKHILITLKALYDYLEDTSTTKESLKTQLQNLDYLRY